MKQIYYPDDKQYGDMYLDWMGFPINDSNIPSYHHIERVSILKSNSEADVATIENGAYLGTLSHATLHYIEKIDKNLYESWNYIFLVINKMKCYPIDDIWKIIINLQDLSIETIENNVKVKKKS